jgi:hypothetical protein
VEDREYSVKPWGYITEIMELEKNELGYLVLCVNSERVLEKFILEVESD